MFRKLPFVLFIVIALSLLVYPHLSLAVKQHLYSFSLFIQSFILFLLPFIIFSLMFKTMVSMSKQATVIIGLILLTVCVSNFTSTFLSHYIGALIYQFNLSVIFPDNAQILTHLWSFPFPKWVANDKAMFAGIIAGLLLGYFRPQFAQGLGSRIDDITMKILNSFIFLIPIFIVGFVIKLQYDGVIMLILKDYALIFALIAIAQFTYILLAYLILNHFHFSSFTLAVKNMLPATVAGFSTMSSAAVMPLTIKGVENNAQNKPLAKSLVPATVNIHLVGDCFAIPILAYAIMKSYGFAEPALFDYLIFVFYFVLAKFSVAAIPGGGIVVMLPILQSTLGFNVEMLSLITALYILFDPVITSANVFGNGAFAKLIDKLVSMKWRKGIEAQLSSDQ